MYECRILRAARVQNKAFNFFRIIRRPYVSRTIPGTGTRYRVFIESSSLQQVPRSCCCTRRVTPLESTHGHHLPARAAPARAVRGRCFDPKSAATAPGCGECSASPDRASCRLGRIKLGLTAAALLQYEGFVDNSFLAMAHTSTASSAPDAVPRVPG